MKVILGICCILLAFALLQLIPKTAPVMEPETSNVIEPAGVPSELTPAPVAEEETNAVQENTAAPNPLDEVVPKDAVLVQ